MQGGDLVTGGLVSAYCFGLRAGEFQHGFFHRIACQALENEQKKPRRRSTEGSIRGICKAPTRIA